MSEADRERSQAIPNKASSQSTDARQELSHNAYLDDQEASVVRFLCAK